MITDEDLAVERCVKMIKEHKVTAITGKEIEIQGDTLCVHGDGAKALAFVERIKRNSSRKGSRSGTSCKASSRRGETVGAEVLPPSADYGRWGFLSIKAGQMNEERTGFR